MVIRDVTMSLASNRSHHNRNAHGHVGAVLGAGLGVGLGAGNTCKNLADYQWVKYQVWDVRVSE